MLLRKSRDFGEKISDTVSYIRLHLADLLRLYVVFVVPPGLLASLLGANAFSGLMTGAASGAFASNPLKLLNPSFFVSIFLYVLMASAFSTVVYLHMCGADEQPGRQSYFQYVAKRFFPKLISNLGYGVLLTFMLALTMFIIIIPIIGILAWFFGIIYALICLSLMIPINTMEEQPFFEPVSRAFRLMRGEFWSSFGYLIILVLIFYFISMILTMIVTMIFGVASVISLKPDPSMYTTRYFLVTGLTGVVTQVFYFIVHVGVGILFFSLREQKEGGGLESRIESLGSGDSRLPDEQY